MDFWHSRGVLVSPRMRTLVLRPLSSEPLVVPVLGELLVELLLELSAPHGAIWATFSDI